METPTPTSNQDEVTQPITPSKPNNSKHKTGFDTAWLTAFTWLLVVKEPNSSGDMTDVMYNDVLQTLQEASHLWVQR